MDYISINELSGKWDISKRRIQTLCREGRIHGAIQVGNMWIIPENVSRPADERKKNVVSKFQTDISSRNMLKRAISASVQACRKYGIPDRYIRDKIITIFAASLLNTYFPDKKYEDCCQLITDTIGTCQYNKVGADAIRNVAMDLVNNPTINKDNFISWTYQYLGKIFSNTPVTRTQFFTEQYMVDFLICSNDLISDKYKVVDPCCGGGNFLAGYLEHICQKKQNCSKLDIFHIVNHLYGYDIDEDMVKASLLNIRLRAEKIISLYDVPDIEDWKKLNPCLWSTSGRKNKYGSLDYENQVVNILSGKKATIKEALGEADIVMTNPPFATAKGMDPELRDFLRNNYSIAESDMCVSFFMEINSLLKKNGYCGIVTQTAWMHLDSFKDFRKFFVKSYGVEKIADLGSGAFQDLSGEKTNVALLSIRKGIDRKSFSYGSFKSLGYQKKISSLSNKEYWKDMKTSDVFKTDGSPADFEMTSEMKSIFENCSNYKSYAVPMQGTSTGNAKELIDFYWKHIGDGDWIPVSKGGGYCRWEGLNRYVVKWGKDGEYIKENKGSAIRNVRYFNETQMVFSDTGTSGLNVRTLMPGQIFVASGPGIRVLQGKTGAHMAYLNSRMASCFMKIFSPKLTISAGYISRLPSNDALLDSDVLENLAKRCIEMKRRSLRRRPVNREYSFNDIDMSTVDIEYLAAKTISDELNEELEKLRCEAEIDSEIMRILEVSDEEEIHLDESEGLCAYNIDNRPVLDVHNLDKMICANLDCRCQLKRTKVDGHSLGCDGILEFLSRKLTVNPEYITGIVVKNIDKMSGLIAMYKKMLLQNLILNEAGFSIHSNISGGWNYDDVVGNIISRYNLTREDTEWIRNGFKGYHNEFFYGKGIL